MSRILWAGDSTVKQNDITTYPQTGIGQVMHLYLKKDVTILNYAENGRSTKSFIDEGRLEQIDCIIQPNDFLLIQFGHNDQKLEDPSRYTKAFGEYQTNLQLFLDTALHHCAHPVLVTPLYRRYFDEADQIKKDVHFDYPTAMKALALEQGIPIIDLCEASKALLARTGDEPSKRWFMHLKSGEFENYPDGITDNTHLRYDGAVVMAGLVAEGLARLGGIYSELLLQRHAGLEDGTYQNPIIYADYSDPDVIRVEDTYYMTASSFNYMPGLPILTSKDLINWSLVNYAVRNMPYPVYDKPAHAKGIWAPSIRFHNGYFWIFFAMPDEGIFMTKAKDPFGEWSPMVCIWEGKGFIDPCPYWENGKAYIIHAYAKSRIGFNSKLGILEMTPEATRCFGEDVFLFDGTVTQPTIEGPKIYQRNGYYYILAPAGGVKTGWQTALRSRHLYGSYEEKIVMHQGTTSINGPHQGGLVDTVCGEEWFLHFQDKGVYGRIVHLQPVNWQDDWPVIGKAAGENGIGEPVYRYQKPDGIRSVSLCEPETSDDFTGGSLKLQWQWLANDKESFYSLSERKGSLCLYPMNTTGASRALLWNSANVLTQKIVCPEFTVQTKLDYSELSEGDKAGMLIIGGQYAAMYIQRQNHRFRLVYLESKGDGDIRTELILENYPLKDLENIHLRLNFYEDGSGEFLWKDESDWSSPTRRFSPQGATWVGARIGLFAISDQEQPEGKAYFEYFDVNSPINSK
jgi:beta-xylosidase/lysophospholipase L1-like esterase